MFDTMQSDSVQHAGPAAFQQPFMVMGIVNVTPDSFYDGGVHATTDTAIAHALELAEQGATALDIGGQSTRPGAAQISEDEEIARVVPVIRGVRARTRLAISIDTTRASVAQASLDAGADWINDISAGRFDSRMAGVAARYSCAVILMHSRKTPADMQDNPFYADCIAEVKAELQERIDEFRKAGVKPEKIVVDPGIGFAKRCEDNLAIIRNTDALVRMGYPVLIGASRKSFIGRITDKAVEQRLSGSLAAVAACFMRGARAFRVHDVAETVDFLRMLVAIENGDG